VRRAVSTDVSGPASASAPANAIPSPDEAPVTIATFPSSREAVEDCRRHLVVLSGSGVVFSNPSCKLLLAVYRVKPSQWLPQEASADSVEPSSEAGEVAANDREAAHWYSVQ